MPDTFGVVTGGVLPNSKDGQVEGSITFLPIELRDQDSIVDEVTAVKVPLNPDGSFHPVYLWIGLWRVTLPDGRTFRVVIEAVERTLHELLWESITAPG